MKLARLEEQLFPDELETVRELAAFLAIPADVWPSVPGFRFWTLLAAFRLSRRFQGENGIAEQPALEHAAAYLGLSADAIIRARQRWRKAASNATKCSPVSADGSVVSGNSTDESAVRSRGR